MKKCTNGAGINSTATVLAWLSAGNDFTLANLFLIGEADDPAALWLTDWEAPLAWPIWGTFTPAVITRTSVTSSIGLDAEDMTLTWSPPSSPFTASVATANPYQLAQIGTYDNWKVRIWTVYMPTPGDANTFGCSELFGGRIADTTIQRGSLIFKVKSLMDVLHQQVPTNVIELLNTGASYAGATAPPDAGGNIPQFVCMGNDSVNAIVGDCTTPGYVHNIFGDNALRGGYMVFNAGSTLAGCWSAIQQNIAVHIGSDGRVADNPGGTKYNQFILYSVLPWPPAIGDTFFVSAAAPINQADGEYYGFPYVPSQLSS